tara:strand:- start:674 stop:892 length:219 start_codon:yes stop_codon:yes gene_type:complete
MLAIWFGKPFFVVRESLEILKIFDHQCRLNFNFFLKMDAFRVTLNPKFFAPKSLHGLGQKISPLPNFAVILG